MAGAGPPFRAGRVIGRSLLVWLRHLPLLFALVLVVNLPYIGWSTYREFAAASDTSWDLPPDDPSVGEALAYLVTSFASYGRTQVVRGLFARLSQAVVIFAVYRRLRGERPSFRASLRGGFRRFWPVLRVALGLLVIEFGLTFVLWMPYQLAWLLSSAPTFGNEYTFYAGYGIHALLLLLLTPFWVAIPVAVVDRRGGFLARSWTLTRGRRLRIFVVVLFLTAWEYARYYLLWPITADLSLPTRHTVDWAQHLLVISLGAVLAVVGYRALRLNKEGLDVTTLEGIFD